MYINVLIVAKMRSDKLFMDTLTDEIKYERKNRNNKHKYKILYSGLVSLGL